MPNLIAVFPLPVGSQTMPNRGLRSFQFGTSVRAGNERAGTNSPAGTSVAFTDSRSQSQRRTALIVSVEPEIRIELVDRVVGRRKLRQRSRDATGEGVRHRQPVHLRWLAGRVGAVAAAEAVHP